MRYAQEHLLVINLEGEGRAEEHPGTHGTRLEQSMEQNHGANEPDNFIAMD